MKGFNNRKDKREFPSKKFLSLLILVIMVFPSACTGHSKKTPETLFPEREVIKKQSELFFKNVDTQHPLLIKVDFFTRSEAYLSAYLNLTIYITKNNYLKSLIGKISESNFSDVKNFNDKKKELKINNYKDFREKLSISPLKFYLLILHALTNDYNNNRLSGNHAYVLWNILLSSTEEALKSKEKSVEDAAILEVSSHMVFFKVYKKWKKRVKKILKKASLSSVTDKLTLLVFEFNEKE